MARQLDVQYVRFYTDGSAARKVATVEPLKQMNLSIWLVRVDFMI